MPKKKKIKNGDYNNYKLCVLKCSTGPSLLQASFYLSPTPQEAAEFLTSSCMNTHAIFNIMCD